MTANVIPAELRLDGLGDGSNILRPRPRSKSAPTPVNHIPPEETLLRAEAPKTKAAFITTESLPDDSQIRSDTTRIKAVLNDDSGILADFPLQIDRADEAVAQLLNK
jgi:hypothetical protein